MEYRNLFQKDVYLHLFQEGDKFLIRKESARGSRVIGSFSNVKEALKEYHSIFKTECELGE